MMPPKPQPNLDKNVSPNWKPVAGLEDRKPGLAWSDCIWYWLISLGGLAIAGAGVAVMAYLHHGRTGGGLVGIGLVVFILGSPTQAARNGYRDQRCDTSTSKTPSTASFEAIPAA